MDSSSKVPRGHTEGQRLLLFCVALNPISLLLNNLGGNQATASRQIKHLLYMDDLKLFAKSNAQLEILLRTVHKFSDDQQSGSLT